MEIAKREASNKEESHAIHPRRDIFRHYWFKIGNETTEFMKAYS